MSGELHKGEEMNRADKIKEIQKILEFYSVFAKAPYNRNDLATALVDSLGVDEDMIRKIVTKVILSEERRYRTEEYLIAKAITPDVITIKGE